MQNGNDSDMDGIYSSSTYYEHDHEYSGLAPPFALERRETDTSHREYYCIWTTRAHSGCISVSSVRSSLGSLTSYVPSPASHSTRTPKLKTRTRTRIPLTTIARMATILRPVPESESEVEIECDIVERDINADFEACAHEYGDAACVRASVQVQLAVQRSQLHASVSSSTCGTFNSRRGSGCVRACVRSVHS